MVLASRFISWIRKSIFLPMASPSVLRKALSWLTWLSSLTSSSVIFALSANIAASRAILSSGTSYTPSRSSSTLALNFAAYSFSISGALFSIRARISETMSALASRSAASLAPSVSLIAQMSSAAFLVAETSLCVMVSSSSSAALVFITSGILASRLSDTLDSSPNSKLSLSVLKAS